MHVVNKRMCYASTAVPIVIDGLWLLSSDAGALLKLVVLVFGDSGPT